MTPSAASTVAAAARIVVLAVAAAIVYGVLHDLATTRVCIEYFTIGHPPVFATEDPTLLALGWGVIATWWVGLLLGLPLAFAALRGPRPRRTAGSLLRPLVILLVAMAALALVTGITGCLLARGGVVVLLEPMASRLPAERHVPFLACLWAHSASYLGGFVGGIVLIRRVWQSRRREGAAAESSGR